MSDLLFQSITEVSRLIRSREISVAELIRHALQRISQYDSRINAFISVMEEEALHQASVLDKELSQGKVRSPLHGIPIAIKDILETKGHTTTAGSKAFQDWIPDKDATAVRKLKDAGAILIGKTNLHEFATGATNENPHYGAAHNPWNLQKITGGSSGGSAAAVAAGMSFGALGSDTAGSIRLPASMCGIVGMKPTYGRVSRYGCLPFSWSLDHVGPMTRYVEDAAIMLQIIAGYDEHDSTSSRRPVDMIVERVPDDLSGVVVGVCREYFFEGLHDEVRTHVDKAISRLEESGAEIREINISGISEVLQNFKFISQPESYAYHKPIQEKHFDLYGKDIQARFKFAKTISAHEYIDAQRIRKRFTQEFQEMMAPIDVIAAPVNALPPFTIGELAPEERAKMFYKVKASLANITGFPALSVPCGFFSEQLPIGLQLIGKPFMEKRLLKIAACYEKAEPFAEKLAENRAYLN